MADFFKEVWFWESYIPIGGIFGSVLYFSAKYPSFSSNSALHPLMVIFPFICVYWFIVLPISGEAHVGRRGDGDG